jgi:hypothetical protein
MYQGESSIPGPLAIPARTSRFLQPSEFAVYFCSFAFGDGRDHAIEQLESLLSLLFAQLPGVRLIMTNGLAKHVTPGFLQACCDAL